MEKTSPAFVPDLAVVYLARFAEGPKPVARFVDSYRRHEPGIAHDLVVVRKGFPAHGTAQDRILEGLAATSISVTDDGFDIDAYAAAALQIPHKHVAFLNTFSEIVADDWLLKLRNALSDPLVGLAGATGSYESYRSSMKRVNRDMWLISSGIPGASSKAGWLLVRSIKNLLPRRVVSAMGAKLHFYLAGRQQRGEVSDPEFELFWSREIAEGGRFEYLAAIPEFPNPHLRTNAFIIERKTYIEAVSRPVRSKNESYLFESGPNSLTRRICGSGKKVVVVGRDGMAFDIDRWAESGTFRSRDQRNLLVRDKQTDAFEESNAEGRRALTEMAWGSGVAVQLKPL